MSEVKEDFVKRTKEMEELIKNQNFKIGDAYKFLIKSYNLYRRLEDVEESRDKWKIKYKELKSGKQSKERN